MRRTGDEKGLSLVEVIVTTAVVGVVLGVSVPNLSPGSIGLTTAKQNLANDLRRIRMDATIRGVHFRVTMGPSSYRIERLRQGSSGAWEVDPTVTSRQVDLPSDIALAAANPDGAVANIEFNTRGMVAPSTSAESTAPMILTLSQRHSARKDNVEVWPSGQIRLLSSSQAS